MGMLKELDADSGKVNVVFKIDEAVSFKALVVHFSGLGHATGTHSLDHLGRLHYRIRGQEVINCDIEYLIAYAKLKHGFNAVTFTTNGLIDIVLYIPRWFGRGLPDNVEHITKEDNAEIQIVYGAGLSAAATTPVTWNATLFADLHEGIQSYIMEMHQFSESVGASARLTETYNEENILGVYLSDVASDLLTDDGNLFGATAAAKGRIEFTIGHMHCSCDLHAARANSDIRNQVEAAQADPCTVEIYDAEGDQVNNKLFDRILMHITNGSGGTSTPQILTVGARINKYKLADTQARQASLFGQALTRKDAAGHTSASEVLRKLPTKAVVG